MDKLLFGMIAIGLCAVVNSQPTASTAPAFTLDSAAGKKVSLEDFKGKYVVLEWWNPGCPFVQKHYGSGNMQKLQAKMKDRGVVWLTIDSSAPGMQGHLSADQATKMMKEAKAAQTAVLLDPTGAVGKKFGARTTPHVFLISPKGEILYNGAIDSIATPDVDDIAKATNYLMQAYDEAVAGKPISTPRTKPYGCGVKYAH